MRFNNAQFESKVQQTMKTLTAFDKKLKLDGAEKGLEKISGVAEKMNFTKLESAIENLGSKFSAMEVIGVSALARITSQAVDAGERLVKSLSLDQVTAGWNKYAQKTASVQTIMNATGKSITKVNSYLDKLMWYSDETSYGFTDMTQSLGQLTAAGGDIDKMIPMIMGIANATAYAGKGASEFQRVIYNLNQSYSQGYLNLMDWKSVELAGVATAELKQQIIDTGVELGKIKKGAVTVGTFGSTLSKKWADKEVMETAFGKLADFTMAIKEGVDNGTYKNASEGIAALADQYDEATVKAFKAAQEAKSFSEAIDATKDAVSSGWLETFEIIFGNYDIAKGFWTDLTDSLWDLFAAGKDSRNDLLSGAFDNGWTQMMKSGLSDVSDLLETGLYQGLSNVGVITDEDVEKAGSFGAAVGEALKKGKLSTETLEKALRGAGNGFSKMLDLSDAELKKLGYTRKEVENISSKFTKFFEKVDDGTLSISDFADKMTQTSGREHLFNGILNVLNDISAALQPMKDAFNDILGPTCEGIYKALTAFDEFTGKLQLSEDTADKVQRAFAGFFSVIKMGLSFLKGVGSGIATVFTSLSPVGNSLLTLAANIGDYFVKLEQSSNITGTFSEVLSTLSYILDKVAGGIQKVIDWIIELGTKTSVVFDPIKAVGTWFENFISFITPKLKWLADKIGEIFEELGSGVSGAFGNLNTNAVWGFANAGMIAGLVAGIKGFLAAFKDIGSTIKDTVGGVTELLNKLGEAIAAWKNNKNAETLKTIATAVAILAGSLVVLSMVKPERLAASVGAMISLFIELLAALAIYDEITKKTKKVGKGTSSMVVMAAGVLILSSALKKIADIDSEKLVSSVIALGAVMAELVAAQIAISKWAPDGAKHAMSMLVMAAAVRVLAGAIEQLGSLEWDEIVKGLVAVGGLLAEVAAFSALSKFSELSVGKAAGILILAAALAVLEKSVTAFSKMSLKQIGRGLAAVGGLLAEIAAFSFLSSFADHILSTAVAMTILSGGLLILSNAMANLGGMSLEQIGAALAALGGGLIEMGIALTLVKGSLASAASFLIMAAALNALVSPLKTFSEMSLEEIGHGLLALGGAMGIFAIAVGGLSLIGPIVIGVSLALSLLAGSFALLLGAMAAVSLMPLKMDVLVGALGTLGAAVGVFIAGVIAGLGTAVGSIATAIAEIVVAVCNAIAEAAPAIGDALIELITALCDVLITCMPKIEATVEVLIYALCDVLIACTPRILETIDTVFGNVFSYIGSKLTDLGKWLWEKIKDPFGVNNAVDAAKESGKNVAAGYAEGIAEGADLPATGIVGLAKAAQTAFKVFWGIHSPSKLAAEDAGYIVDGLIQGLGNNTGAAKSAMAALANGMNDAFDNELGLQASTSVGIKDGQLFVSDIGEGVANKADNLCSFMENLGVRAHNAFRSGLGLSGAQSTGTTTQRTSAEIEKELENMVLSPEYRAQLQEELRAAYMAEGKQADDIDWSKFWGSLVNPDGDSGNTDENPTGTTTKSKTKKTLAQQITEKYKTRLEANKALRESMDSEYELWQAENQYSADADTLLAKKTENAAAEIANQTDRVAIAQAKYDELYSKWGADKTETRQAYADLLSEKTSLAKLKSEQYTNLFEDVAKRYDTNLSTLEKEYSLWTAENDKTATKTDKLNRETEYMTAELEVKQKKLANAQEQYDTLKAQYGEQDLRTLEAYNDLLDAQTEAAKLQADIANQELELIKARIDAISSAQSRMQTRMDILSTAYDDGSLSERESAYEQAVEQYGKDSEEARKARFQGTTSAILSTVTALKNLNYQMQQTNKLQAELAELTPGTATYDSKQSEILSSKSSFIGFASNLADALNMEDTGKRAMLIFANSIQDHWGEVSKAFQTVMTKVSAGMSEGMKQTFSDAFGWMSSDEGIQMETEFISAISSALQGDWGGAVASAFAFGMDLAFSDAGKSAREWVAKLFAEDILPGIQNGSGQLTEVIGQAMGEIGKMAQGSGGVVETLGNIGTVLSNVGGVLMSFLSEFWWVFLIVGAIAAVIGGIAWYANKKKQSQGSGIYDVGKDLNKDFADGVEDGFDDVDNAVTDMTENAVDIARGALSTIDRVIGDDYEYTPQITPVVDLSNVIESADEATGAFEATTKAMTLDDDVSRKMAAQIEAQAEIQNGLKQASNAETLNAISALGAHMDGVAQSIKGMSVNINGRKTIGYIDSEMGRRVAAKVR
uniref:Tail tape measure n=1 Tax=Siphoviridae sp. ctx254 TaxID=2825737 RepID=A0A8S5TVG9_9CAUD|nr:MAG TPA: tail tape measure [Siphoviridae sp. ctx254]